MIKFCNDLLFCFGILFGSLTTCVYLFMQLIKLTPQEASEDPMYYLLLRDSFKYVNLCVCVSLVKFRALLVSIYFSHSILNVSKMFVLLGMEWVSETRNPLSSQQDLSLVP